MAMTLGTALRRIVATVTVLLAVTTAFAAGFLVSDARHDQRPMLDLTAAGLDSGLSCDRLRQWYVDHGLDRVTAWGWQIPAMRAAEVPQAGVAENSVGIPDEPLLGHRDRQRHGHERAGGRRRRAGHRQGRG